MCTAIDNLVVSQSLYFANMLLQDGLLYIFPFIVREGLKRGWLGEVLPIWK